MNRIPQKLFNVQKMVRMPQIMQVFKQESEFRIAAAMWTEKWNVLCLFSLREVVSVSLDVVSSRNRSENKQYWKNYKTMNNFLPRMKYS